jgi:hypothetical protein
MIINKIKNKDGYTLTYAIVVIGVLLILMASIVMITFFNFRLARVGGEVNTSFYANDGAIEEALTELSRYTYNAEVGAWAVVNGQAYLTSTEWKDVFLPALYDDVNLDVLSVQEANNIMSHAIRGIFETNFYNALLDTDASQAASHVFFNPLATGTDKYLDYSGYTGVTFNGALQLNSTIRSSVSTTLFQPDDIIDATEVLGVEDDAEITSVVVDAINTSGITLTIKSDGTYHARNKKMSVQVTIKPPEYNFTVSTKTETLNLRKNDITDYPLIAKGDIVFNQGITSVSGPIYAYGSTIDFMYDQDRSTYGGIIINAGSDVSVTGSAGTRNTVKFTGSGARLSVTDDLYANSVSFLSASNGSDLNIGENLYIYSDLYVGANDVDVTLATSNPDSGSPDPRLGLNIDTYRPTTGTLYAVLPLHPVAGEDYTRTGSIIVNPNTSDTDITLNGLFLSGVIRYDLLDKSKLQLGTPEREAYKTGESFTTYRNKEYYQTLTTSSIYEAGVISSLEKFIINAAGDLEDPDNTINLISFNDALDSNLAQTHFRAIHFYTLGYKAFLERAGGSEPYELNEVNYLDKSIIQLRNPLRDASKAFWGVNTNGIVQFKDAAVADQLGKVYHPDIINMKSFLNNSGNISREIDLGANILGFSDYTDILNGNYHDRDLMMSSSSPLTTWLDPTVDAVNAAGSSDTVLQVYSKNGATDIYINYDTVQTGINFPGVVGLANETFQGVVVTAGDVYINADAGEITRFIGNIVTSGDIILTGSGTKEIVHDELTIYSNINKYPELRDLYHTDLGRQLSITGYMYTNNLLMSIVNNTETIDVNFVNDMMTGGASIIESDSLTINSWVEED